jgi:hypothetical protein
VQDGRRGSGEVEVRSFEWPMILREAPSMMRRRIGF